MLSICLYINMHYMMFRSSSAKCVLGWHSCVAGETEWVYILKTFFVHAISPTRHRGHDVCTFLQSCVMSIPYNPLQFFPLSPLCLAHEAGAWVKCVLCCLILFLTNFVIPIIHFFLAGWIFSVLNCNFCYNDTVKLA